jgi:signal transduction histidine kinase
MEKLFHPYFRNDPSKQGLGLGLHIAAEIAKAHGGTLVASSDAEATRFTLNVPCGQSREQM